MADDLAKDIIRRQERLKAGRGVFESHWQEIAELVHPMRADFLGPRTPGEKRSRHGATPPARWASHAPGARHRPRRSPSWRESGSWTRSFSWSAPTPCRTRTA